MINQNCIDMQDISKKMQNFCNSFQLLCLCIQNNCSIAHGQNQKQSVKKSFNSLKINRYPLKCQILDKVYYKQPVN